MDVYAASPAAVTVDAWETGARQWDLELIVPTFNEGRRIGPTLRALQAELARLPVPARLVVVDNGSVDDTADVVDLMPADPVPVTLIGCRTKGKGAAVREAVRHAASGLVGYCDADLSTPPETVKRAIDALLGGADVVIGSRRCPGAAYAVSQPLSRRIGSRAFRLAAARVAGPVTDTQCGFKFFRTEVARAVFARCRTDGFAFDVEVIARARQAGAAIVEIPVSWSHEHGSSFRTLPDGLAAFRELARVRQLLAAG